MNLEYLVPKQRRWPWQGKRAKWFWLLAATVVAAIIIAVAVPLAVILPRKDKHAAAASVILPLYIYPHDNTTWRPVYEALQRHPKLNFTIVVNPKSGPGDGPAPNDEYTEAITQLSSYANAQLLGYVRTGYATRNVSDVLDEISVYAGWSSTSRSLAMHGIFLDEAPHEYSEDAVDFMRTVGQAIKRIDGLYQPKTIVHNPGTIPAQQFLDHTLPDITVIFEHDYEAWTNGIPGEPGSRRQAAADLLSSSNNRSAYSLMVHSVPPSTSLDRDFVESLAEIAEYLFVTTNDVDYYESFADDWAGFVDLVPEGE